jgi:hypothetical protein
MVRRSRDMGGVVALVWVVELVMTANGAAPSQSATGSSVTVGGFAEADANWGPITGSGTYSRGMEVNQSGSSGLPGFGWRPYGGLGGSVTGSFPGDGFKGSACAAVGIEVTTTRGK